MSGTEVSDLLLQARAHTRHRRYPDAIAAYQSLLTADPDSVDAHEGLAMACFLSGNFEQAVAQFVELTLLQPLEARHYVNMGAALNRIGRHSEAADALRKAIQRNRKSADAYYNLGIAQKHLKQTSMAVSAYKEAIRIDPQMAEAHQNLGNVYLEMGSYKLALTSFQKALEIRPDFAKARVGLERAEDAMNADKEARNPFGRLVETVPHRHAADMGGRTLTEEERHDDRQKVWGLAQEIKALTEACSSHLHDNLEAQLKGLARVIAENRPGGAILEAAEAFRVAATEWVSLRQQMRRKLVELRAHEEFLHTPDLPV